MLRIKKVSEVVGKKVYTDSGDFFGEIEEANLIENKLDGWKIRVSGEITNFLGGARGVIIPYNYLRAVGDVVLINKTAIPPKEEASDLIDEPI